MRPAGPIDKRGRNRNYIGAQSCWSFSKRIQRGDSFRSWLENNLESCNRRNFAQLEESTASACRIGESSILLLSFKHDHTERACRHVLIDTHTRTIPYVYEPHLTFTLIGARTRENRRDTVVRHALLLNYATIYRDISTLTCPVAITNPRLTWGFRTRLVERFPV